MNIDADIIPSIGLGGVLLRKRISEYTEALEELKLNNAIEFKQTGLYETSYKIESYSLEIFVDTRNGKIFKIAALTGYRGCFNGKVYAGMSMKNAFKIDNRLYFKEADAVVLCKDIEGIAIDLGVDDPWPEEVMELNADSIIVYAPEVFSFEGRLGNW